MAELRPAVQGDSGDTRTVQLDGIDNLNAVTAVVGHVFTVSQRVVTHVANLDAAVANPAENTVVVELGVAPDGWLPTATPGKYLIEYQVTFANGDVITWPSPAGDTIVVRAQGDPPVETDD